ncbi:hypothetical protein VN12_03320 [Pirellula sp. SH-Sr6A]|uniref:DUF447 domain-containing protein n=1 Tax=Pirellula sp. SH-Sr6A TaxID=1632865 RepID=UPI00078D51C2|nr:DUF447 domain-containing protein [Pirellula sp. SH-Sr6A]AMV31121.1 hypothetical protein VN12_03320 [Pirellula sp. SH-Sr6A]
MIIEGIITTENADGSMHVAPIGPHVDRELQSWSVKPFQTSTTFQNLIRTNRAIFHVTDDALLMAASVLGIGNTPSPEVLPPTRQQHWSDRIQQRRASKWVHEKGWVLEQACRAFALRAERWDVSAPRAHADCSVVHSWELRPFWGWNRAKHSILELAILVSRRQWLPPNEWQSECDRHRVFIDKTAGEEEHEALELLQEAMST